jgi:hypothetical protein
MTNFGLPTGRAIYRFFRDTGDAGVDVLFFSLADHLAARGPSLDIKGFREHAEMTDYVLREYFKEAGLSSPPRIIDGYEIMELLGIPAGRTIGALLEALREAQAAGEIKDKNQAVAYIKQLYLDKYQNLPGVKNEEK